MKKNQPSFSQFFLSLLAGTFLVISCQKDPFLDNPSARLSFSVDTLKFDTVFTTVGSTTQYIKVFNTYNDRFLIDEIRFGSGASYFRMNVDGESASSFKNVEIPANDSLYIFVETTLDATDENLPFIIEDSIQFFYGGAAQKVLLTAWGQNANFYDNVELCDETWIDEKPYVVYNALVVPPDCKLTILEGVDVHLHPNSRFLIFGELEVLGTTDSLVSFQGTRLEDFFDNVPGQWTGIELLRGSKATINNALIKNHFNGLSIGSAAIESVEQFDTIFVEDNAPAVLLNNCIIANAYQHGIASFRSNVTAINCLIYACGTHNAEFAFGGNYAFNHCTFANYGTVDISHRDPVLSVGHAVEVGEGNVFFAPTQLRIENSIIYGSETEELELPDSSNDPEMIDFLFKNCLLRTEFNIDSTGFENCIKNTSSSDTIFVSTFEKNFQLNTISPAIDRGFFTGVLEDIDGNLRDGQPDLGCYELVE